MLMWQISVAIINLALAIAALMGLRFGMSAIIGVHAKDELDKKDNFAFGIAIAGGVLALTIIMSGAVSGDAHASLLNESLNVLIYAVLGIALLKIGFLLQDKLVIRGLSTSEEIKSGNIAAAIVVAINLIATGIVIRTSISWGEDDGLMGLLPVVLVYIATQLVLAAVTAIRAMVYAKRNPGKSWKQAIEENNVAVAIRFAGQLLATALAMTSISSLVPYESILLVEMTLTWLGLGLAVMLGVWIIYRLVFPIVLVRVNISEEVDQQGNIGVAAIEGAIFVGIASLFIGFLA